jgi:hypothetical protein
MIKIVYIKEENSKYLKTDDQEFMKLFKDIVMDNPYKKLKDVEGFPKYLDLENLEYLFIGDEYIKMCAGGDWQQMINFSFAVLKKDNKPVIIDLYDSDIQKSYKKEVSEYLNKIKELGIEWN